MKAMFIFMVAVCVTETSFAAPKQIPVQQAHVQASGIFLGKDKGGNPAYFAIVNGQAQPVTMGFIDSAVNDLIETAKKEACGMKIRPDSVTGSIGFLSFTWETERLCK